MLDRTNQPPDGTPPAREPISNIPRVIIFTLAVLAGIHLVRQFVPQDWDDAILLRLAFEPGTVTHVFAPDMVERGLRLLAMQGDAGFTQAQVGQFFLDQGGLQPWTALTYGLLHADWVHVGSNGLWLVAFGTPVARRLRAGRFMLFLAAACVAGAAAHYVTHPLDLQPIIGASAAVSGCMGAALRFMFQPPPPVASILGLGNRRTADPAAVPLMRFDAMIRDRRVTTFAIVWFLTNFVFAMVAQPLGFTNGPIAWEAHIGGFLLGLIGLRWFDRPMAPEVAELDEPVPDP